MYCSQFSFTFLSFSLCYGHQINIVVSGCKDLLGKGGLLSGMLDTVIFGIHHTGDQEFHPWYLKHSTMTSGVDVAEKVKFSREKLIWYIYVWYTQISGYCFLPLFPSWKLTDAGPYIEINLAVHDKKSVSHRWKEIWTEIVNGLKYVWFCKLIW